jgi:predicted porin
MKKSLLAVAVAAALPAVAQAQSSVTLYGILDASVEWSNDSANSAINDATGVVTAADSTLRLSGGGAANQSGSRFGVRGVEDLGGGLKAVFTIEHRLDVSDGGTSGGLVNANSTRFWNGQAWVGLEGGWGRLTAGRQYTPIFWALLPADFTGYGWYNNWAGISGQVVGGASPQGPIRLDNSLSYRSPTFGGLTVYAVYAFGEQTTGIGDGDVWGIAAGWQLGGLYVGAGYHSIDVAQGVNSADSVLAGTISYKMASWGVSLGYTMIDYSIAGEFSNILGSAFLNIGPGTLYFNVLYVDPSDFVGRRNDTGLQYGLAYSMPISKRTNWYVAVGYNDLAGIQLANSTQLIDDALRVSVGLRHLF